MVPIERMTAAPPGVTMLLRDWRAGDLAAADRLMPLVYDELRGIAARFLRNERAGHPLRPTELVSEAYLRLSAGEQPAWNDRLHFFAIAARNMRRVLVEHARHHGAKKRGARPRMITLDETHLTTDRSHELLGLDEALEALARIDERKARVIELHYFAGLTQDEIALVLDVHVNTIGRDLRLAEAWIHRRLQDPPGS